MILRRGLTHAGWISMQFLRPFEVNTLLAAGFCFAVGTIAAGAPLRSDEQVTFFPTVGYPSKGGWGIGNSRLDLRAGEAFGLASSILIVTSLRKAAIQHDTRKPFGEARRPVDRV